MELLTEKQVATFAEKSILDAIEIEIKHFEQLMSMTVDMDDLIKRLDKKQGIAIGRPYRALCARFKPKNHCSRECPLFTAAFAACCREYSKIGRTIQLYLLSAANDADVRVAILGVIEKLQKIKADHIQMYGG